MPVDLTMAARSDNLLFACVLVYSLAMLAYAAEYAATRAGARRRPRAATVAPVGLPVAVPVGAGSAPAPSPTEAPNLPSPGEAGDGARGERLGRIAVALTGLGFLLHVGSVVTRGLAADRWPWGNMYEYSSMVALLTVAVFLVVLRNARARYLGAFVLLFVVLFLGLAGTVLYVPAGPLIPALQSYWIAIHVAAAITASGAFTVGAIATALYLLRARYDARTAAGRPGSAFARALPAAASLDRVAYRVHAFAFPVWTFAVIAGAIWAEAAWGRYWGWDPKETWSFITWVIYAGYLHARATAGMKGRKAAVVALVGYSALTIDYYVVNIFLVGFHSYAGV